MRAATCLIAVICCCLAAHADDKVRIWTDVDGHTMEAQFVREIDGDATFLKDGKLVHMPLDRLSEKDQKLIRALEAGKKVEQDQPPAGAVSRDNLTDADESAPTTEGGKGRPSLTNQKVVPEIREWCQTSGRKTTGKFVRYHEGNVILTRQGRVASLPFDTLSPADKRYVRQWLAAKGDDSQLPPPLADEFVDGSALEGDARAAMALPVVAPLVGDVSRELVDQAAATGGLARGGFGSDGSTANAPSGFEQISAYATVEKAAEAAESHTHSTTPSLGWRLTTHANLARHRPPLVALLIGMPIGLAIGSLIGAIFLRIAASWVLWEEVPFAEAYVTALLSYVINGLLGFGIGLIFGAITQAADSHHLISLLMLPIGFLVQSSVISSRLDTDYGSACLITLVMTLISFLVAVIIGVMFFAVFLAAG